MRRGGRRFLRGSPLPPQLLLLLAPIGLPAAGACPPAVERDIPYVTGGGHKQQLDLFLPAGRGYPLILFVHGGSLTTGDRTEPPYASVCQSLSSAGLGCAAMSYRLFPDVRWPAPAQDVAAAFGWLKRNIAGRGGDPDRIFLVGHSSGCLLVTLLAADPSYLKPQALSPRDVAGVVSMGCRLNDRMDATGIPPERIRRHFETDPYDGMFGSVEALNNAVPTSHVGSHLPPVLVLVAETERFQPPILEDATAFAAAARKAGARVEVEVLKDRTHMSAVEKLASPDDPTLWRILRFVRETKPPS